MSIARDDARWMGAALALAERGHARTGPNPNVGCVIVRNGRVTGRGWTQPGGRPHAEAMALTQAGDAAKGATAYVTLEPCAHQSTRGPSCADVLAAAGVARVVAALTDPDPRTDGKGLERLKSAGIETQTDVMAADARRGMAGWLSQLERNRPFVTLKLATSLDGCIARADGESKWITGDAARAHAHLERARHEAILVGRGTLEADTPRLDVRLPGLEGRSPRRAVLSGKGILGTVLGTIDGVSNGVGETVPKMPLPEGWHQIASPEAISVIDAQYLMVEGGAGAAASFLRAGLVDRILLYRAPIVIGGGKACLADIGLDRISDAHGQWRCTDKRTLGSDTLEVYEAALCSQE